MPYLLLGAYGSVTVPLRIDTPRRREVPVGAVRPAFSGAPRSTVRDYRITWEGAETDWLTREEADDIRAELKATPPIPLDGDLTGPIDAMVTDIQEVEKSRAAIDGVSTEIVRLGFTILEA